jgi:hypothetical protein
MNATLQSFLAEVLPSWMMPHRDGVGSSDPPSDDAQIDDRCRTEDHLQCGLEDTFPASDPISAVFTSIPGCPKK